MRNRLAFTIALALLAGCAEKNAFVEPPPPTVTVACPEIRTVTTYQEFPGRTEAQTTVEVRARVLGRLEKKGEFEEGGIVKKDDLLYMIEEGPYKAALDAATADVAKATAARDIAKVEFERKQNAFDSTAGKAVSKLDVEAAEANLKGMEAALLGAAAAVEKARIDHEYTTIKAPASGRVSRSLVDVGNLVGGGEMTLLTTIVNDDPVRVFFEASEREALEHLGNRPTLVRPELDGAWRSKELRLELSDGTVYDEVGHIDFADNRIDPNSGTIRIRAMFPNAEAKLAAGLFVRVRVPEDAREAVLVPRVAVQRDMRGSFVLVVDGNSTVVRKDVRTGPLEGGSQIIESGLAGDERIIVAGIQVAREGGKVTAVEAEAASGDADGETPGKAP